MNPLLATSGLSSPVAFEFTVKLANRLPNDAMKNFSDKQGQYLAFIYYYRKVNGRSPAELDMEHYFRVSAPSVHGMVLRLEASGFIERTPGKGRSIRLLIPPA